MASLRALRMQRTVAVLVFGAGATAITHRRPVHAEAPEPDLPQKKPIYSDLPTASTTSKPPSTSLVSKPNPTNPTPTDRLTTQVRKVRTFVHDQSLAAENGVNTFMSWAFKQETSFTNTIASLAPSPETGEQLLPGAIYVLVATLGGTIMTRNRGILLRATFPLAVGITAGWLLIPVTMTNIADLSWKYEEKVPFISSTHAQISGLSREAWTQAKVHAKQVTQWADDTTGQSRKKIESWVEKGR